MPDDQPAATGEVPHASEATVFERGYVPPPAPVVETTIVVVSVSEGYVPPGEPFAKGYIPPPAPAQAAADLSPAPEPAPPPPPPPPMAPPPLPRPDDLSE
jgi:hypothetical protein